MNSDIGQDYSNSLMGLYDDLSPQSYIFDDNWHCNSWEIDFTFPQIAQEKQDQGWDYFSSDLKDHQTYNQPQCNEQDLENPFPVELFLASTTVELLDHQYQKESLLFGDELLTPQIADQMMDLQINQQEQEHSSQEDPVFTNIEEEPLETGEELEESKEEKKNLRYVNGMPIELSKIRGDVALKTILRYMRKYYLEDFKQQTQYISYNRRNKNKFYLNDCLKSFIELMFSQDEKLQTTAQQPDEEELIFFLGSIFYPKIMKKQYRSQQKRSIIDGYHKALYSFSASKLKAMNEVSSYRYLVTRFINSQQEILLTQNKTFAKAIEDYKAAFSYIKKYAMI